MIERRLNLSTLTNWAYVSSLPFWSSLKIDDSFNWILLYLRYHMFSYWIINWQFINEDMSNRPKYLFREIKEFSSPLLVVRCSEFGDSPSSVWYPLGNWQPPPCSAAFNNIRTWKAGVKNKLDKNSRSRLFARWDNGKGLRVEFRIEAFPRI